MANLQQNKNVKKCIDVALDCRKNIQSGDGGSQDLIMVQVDDWSDEFETEVEQMKVDWDVFAPGRLKISSQQMDQFPDAKHPSKISRQQRRALERAAKKRRI